MITLKFTDTDITQSNPKSARAWLRRNNMNVRQCVKKGDVWTFEFALGKKVSYKAVPQKRETKPKIVPNVQRIPRPQDKLHKPKREITNTAVKGKDLRAGDKIIDLVKGYDLTIGPKGVHRIAIPATDLTRIENRFLGFYSVESGEILSYGIDPERIYDVSRTGE